MTFLRFLLNEPLRRRIRLLQAELELLASRVEHLEQALEAASFPDSATRQKLKPPSDLASLLRRRAPSSTAHWSRWMTMLWKWSMTQDGR